MLSLVVGDEPAGEHSADQRGDQRRDPDRARVVLESVAEGVAARAEDRRPDEAAERVEQQEARPGEMVDPGEEGGEGAQHGDEAAEEDDLAAVPLEQILRHLQPALVDADVAPVAIDERKAELAPDPIAGVVADDRRRRRAEDDENDVERTGGGETAALTSAVSPGIGTPALSSATRKNTAK